MGLQDLTGSANQIRMGLQDLTDKEQQFKRAYEVSQRDCRISRVRNISDRTCLRGIRMGLQALTGKEQQFQHAYEVFGRGCSISRVGNIRSNTPTMYQFGAAGSHGLGTTNRTCLLGIRRGPQDLTGSKHQTERAYYVSGRRCMISRARNTTSYMPTRYPDCAARSHGFGTSDRTCIEGIRKGLQDLKGKAHQILNAYEISGPGCSVSRVRTN